MEREAENSHRLELEQKLLELGAKVDQLEDGLGEKVDPGIRDMVIGLMAYKVNTLQSCEGHDERAEALPWVDIGAPAPVGWKNNTEKQEMWRRWNEKEVRIVAQLLTNWYEQRKADNDEVDEELRLDFTPKGIYGEARLEPASQRKVSELDAAERQQAAPPYRAEMQNFADYLRRRFLEEGKDST